MITLVLKTVTAIKITFAAIIKSSLNSQLMRQRVRFKTIHTKTSGKSHNDKKVNKKVL